MTNSSGFRTPEPSEGEKRFDEDAARRILRRAAEEQTRQEGEKHHSYSLAQLQEIATEAGISPDAVRTAMEQEAAGALATAERAVAEDERAGGWLATLQRRMRIPASWSPWLKRTAVAAGVVGLLAVVIADVGAAPVVFALAVLVLAALLLLLVGLGPV